MVKDYNSNSTNLDSEDEDDPRTPASVSSQVHIINHLDSGQLEILYQGWIQGYTYVQVLALKRDIYV